MEKKIYGCQGYMGLKYHMEKALIEKNRDPNNAVSNPKYAIFSHKYYETKQSA